ncbi:MAG TPA: type II toxin-antitoxin system RelE/ParE family toxin [Acetobacteraceae bacterium]|nr:type II toxin-antitoxin system RelE/ParE family toxin [Acetobacteraceae bacterium]
MNARLFAPRARRELREASLWIARTNPAAARALITEAEHAAGRLADRPLLGRRRPELLPDPYRFWSLRGFPYLLVYNSTSVPPRILRVLHTARDLPPLLADLGP